MLRFKPNALAPVISRCPWQNLASRLCRAGSLGEGIYFAANASYSLAYTLSKQALKPAVPQTFGYQPLQTYGYQPPQPPQPKKKRKATTRAAAAAAAAQPLPQAATAYGMLGTTAVMTAGTMPVPMAGFAPLAPSAAAGGFGLSMYAAPAAAVGAQPGAYGGFAGAAGGTAAATRAGGAPQQQPQQAPLVFPGSAGAMLLCRVAMGRLTAGGMGMRKPPKGYDSVHMGSTAQSLAAATALQAAEAADGTGEVWEVQRVLGRDLIVTVFDNMQAYPEYIVHFN